MRLFAILFSALLLVSASTAAGCGFSGSKGQQPDAKEPDPDAGPKLVPWWDLAWQARRKITVATGAVLPDRGYQGYTVALALDTTGIAQEATCNDLRVLVWAEPSWTELPVHRLGCGPGTELRFALPVDLAAGAAWTDAYLYSGNAAAAAPPPVTPTNVYLWWDDTRSDRNGDYLRGRMDPWQGVGFNDNLTWNGNRYYIYNNFNDSQASFRRAVDERDVLVEVELFHTGCQPNNMQTGVCLRGVIDAGTTGADETSAHYYCSSRAHNPNCNDLDDPLYDGDIVKGDNEALAVNNPVNPNSILLNQWRRQALAAFGVNPTQLRFWDADASWPKLAYPPADKLLTQGTDADAGDFEARGFAGLMTSQDTAYFRNLVIRRYVEPEPVVSYSNTVEARPMPTAAR